MRAVLKDLYSTDLADAKTYTPEEEDNFGFLLRAEIGAPDAEGAESFDITVCTPKWLAER
jgi:hypothetical protein